MGILDTLLGKFKKKKGLSYIFKVDVSILSIAVRRQGGIVIDKINGFIEKCETQGSSLYGNPNLTVEAAKITIGFVLQQLLNNAEIKKKLNDVSMNAKTDSDKVCLAHLETMFNTTRKIAVSIPQIFENPISQKKNTGINACKLLIKQISSLIDALSKVEESVEPAEVEESVG